MNKEIENPFFESFADYWVSGIKVLKWRYDNFVKKDLGKWGRWGEKYPLAQMPKWEVKNQIVFATNLQLLFEEIASNLDECKAAAEPDMERYLFSLLKPFKEYTDIMHNDNLKRYGELSFEYWAGFNSWVFDEIQRAKAPEPQPEESPEPQPEPTNNNDGVYLGCVYTMSNLFGVAYMYANMLDAVLLERGFDLLSIQRQVGITLLSRRDLTQIGYYLGTPERAKTLISKVAPEPEPPQPQPEGAGLPDVLNTDEAKTLLDRLCKAGYCDSVYKWVNGTAYQAAQAAYNISVILWKGNKWKPFETYWGFANMAQTFAKNRLEAKQKDIDDIDRLFPENKPPEKDLVKL